MIFYVSKKVICNFTMNILHDRKDGNSWSSGPAPPPPPGTPPATRRHHKSGSNSSPSDGNGSSKSGIGGGGIAGIVISILIVGAIVAFFLVKRRSRRSSSDIEKLDDNQPFAPLAPNEVQGNSLSICNSARWPVACHDKSILLVTPTCL